jgi:hypothetical protein
VPPEEDFPATLRRLTSLIRIGWPLADAPSFRADGDGDPLGDHIEKLFGDIRTWAEDEAAPHDKLHFRLLEAEFEYAFGRSTRAAARLNGLVSDELKLREALEANQQQNGAGSREKRRKFADDTDTPQMLQTKIWSLMGTLFFYDYSVNGDVESPVRGLNALLNVVNKELQSLMRRALTTPNRRTYEPHGTRTQIYLFLAQVHRTKFERSRTEDCFRRAQVESAARLVRELHNAEDAPLEERHERRATAVQFSVATTVRVLGGLGRMGMLGGRLNASRQLWQSCLTLLVPTGHMPLRRVVTSHLAIIDRRLAQPGHPDWHKAIEQIEQLFHAEFKTDFDGRRRCAQDLARGYLELAETFGAEDDRGKRTDALKKADGYTDWLEALARDRGADTGAAERYRAHLLRARRWLLDEPPDIERAAEEERLAAEELHAHPACALDLAGFDHVRLGLTSALLTHVRSTRQPEDAQLFETAAKAWKSLIREAQKIGHRELECESWLRLALLQGRQKHFDDVGASLFEGERLVMALDNAALSALHLRVLRLSGNIFNIPKGTYTAARRELRVVMVKRTYAQTGSVNKTAKKLGIGRPIVRQILDKKPQTP